MNNRMTMLAAIIHAVFMIALLLTYLDSPFSLEDEDFLIRATSGVKHSLLKLDEKPDPDRFLFVNVSWEKQLIPKLDSNGFPVGNIDITNRESLGKFLQAVNQAPDGHKFIIVDVRFYLPAPNDSLLAAELRRVKNCLVSYHKGEDDQPRIPIFEGAPYGLSDMESQVRVNEAEMVLKYHLLQGDTLKTTPLLMYEQLYGTQLTSRFLFDELNGKRVFNSYILDHPIREFDLRVEQRYPYVYLGELLMLPPEAIQAYVKDKIVILGDFEDTDIHKTIYGPIPGPIILLNSFLTLERGDNVFSIWLVLFLLVFFTGISYKALKVSDPITRFAERKFKRFPFVANFVADFTFYLVYFGVVSVLTYLLFNVHLTILFMAFYMRFLEIGVKYLVNERVKRRLPAFDPSKVL